MPGDLTEEYWQLLKMRYSYYDEETMGMMRRSFLNTVQAWPLTRDEVNRFKRRLGLLQ